jgi:mono/diheme cytochrome c family protein
MSKIKSSSTSRSGAKIGVIFIGLFFLALIVVILILGLNLGGFLSSPQAALESPVLGDEMSPEVVAEWRGKEAARLTSYGWVDKEAEVAHIPIEQAMAVVAEQGLPVGEPTETPTPTVAPTPTPASEAPAEAAAPTSEPAPTATPAPTVDLANVSFQDHVLPIFEQHCTECHGGDEPEEGLRLTSHAEVMAGSFNGSVVEPGDVENSYLIEQIVTGRMPKRGPKLTPQEIEIITAWVEAGAPDN